MKATLLRTLRSLGRDLSNSLVSLGFSCLAIITLFLLLTGRPVNEYLAPMGLCGTAVGFCLRWLLDRRLNLDWMHDLGPRRGEYLTRLFITNFFAVSIITYLDFCLRAGWNVLRLLTLAGYLWAALVQMYFAFKVAKTRQEML